MLTNINTEIKGKVRLVPEGPDLPARLLDTHAEGKVVFIVGAGISMNAGKPTFAQLVESISENETGEETNPLDRELMSLGQYDLVVSRLEHRHKNGKLKIRKSAAKILSEFKEDSDTSTHKALLALSKDRFGDVHLVTTNFDRVFIEVSKDETRIYEPPELPIPYPGRWNGVVHIHGMLPEQSQIQEVLDRDLAISLQNLVFSYSDFAEAYTNGGVVARFLSELMTNYTVCFVGCSLNDEMTSRVISAFSRNYSAIIPSSQMTLWEKNDDLPPRKEFKAFAFVPTKSIETITEEEDDWNMKGITPIFYELTEEGHSALHNTLKKWAKIHKVGIDGKASLVEEILSFPAETWTEKLQENEKMLWALQDPRAAKRFWELSDETTVTRWLNLLGEYFLKEITDTRIYVENISPTSQYLIEWMMKYASNPNIPRWIAKNGGTLAKCLDIRVRSRLNDTQQDMPSGMFKIWDLLLNGAFIQKCEYLDLRTWESAVETNGMTLASKKRIIELLTPYISVPNIGLYGWMPMESQMDEIRSFLSVEVKVADDDFPEIYQTLKNLPQWQETLPDMLDDFTKLLRDALILLEEIGKTQGKIDNSIYMMPSISDSLQNKDYQYDWAILIRLVRDAWVATCKIDKAAALAQLETWRRIEYTAFRRLRLFASTFDVVSTSYALESLLEDEHKWLWESETQRETCRLLAVLPVRLNKEQLLSLEGILLDGPPPPINIEGLDAERWESMRDWDICLRLQRVIESGAMLSDTATKRLNEIKKRHPEWKETHERHEFPIYMFEEGELENNYSMPKSQSDIETWLKENNSLSSPFADWRRQCREAPESTLGALFNLSQNYNFVEDQLGLVQRWSDALWSWEKEDMPVEMWQKIATVFRDNFDELAKKLGSVLGTLMCAVADDPKHENDEVLKFFDLMTKISYPPTTTFDIPLNNALNHPMGKATRALITVFFAEKKAESPIDHKFRKRFEIISDKSNKHLLPARTILASRTFPLYMIDSDWAEKHIISMFDWEDSKEEACSAWSGYFWTLKYNDKKFLRSLRPYTLQAAKHYQEMPQGREVSFSFLNFLIWSYLLDSDLFSHSEMKRILERLDPKDIAQVASAVNSYLSSHPNKEECWRKHILPFFQKILPQWERKINFLASHRFAEICLQTGKHFSEAVQELKNNFIPNWDNIGLIRDLKMSGFCESNPEASLSFLTALIDGPMPIMDDFNECMDMILEADNSIHIRQEFKDLSLATGYNSSRSKIV